MCDTKKLCTCDAVPVGADHWKLEFHYGLWPSWGSIVETRPEHLELAKDAMKKGEHIMGPMPMPMFEELHKGLAEEAHMELAIRAEEDWLNQGDPFDFEYQPFEGDRLMFHIGGHEIAFSYKNGKWKHFPHQAYSQDNRRMIDAVSEDRIARSKAASYLKSKRANNANSNDFSTTMKDEETISRIVYDFRAEDGYPSFKIRTPSTGVPILVGGMDDLVGDIEALKDGEAIELTRLGDCAGGGWGVIPLR